MTGSPSHFTVENVALQCGAVLPKAQLVYQTYGRLAPDRSNVILYPTSYGAQHTDIEWLIHPDGILNPDQWFIVIPNQFGNGLSTSPSNCQDCNGSEQGFWFTHVDNVQAQAQLLRDVFGVDRLALIYGWSMGAQQAYHWGAIYPDRVDRIVALCGTARTTEHNRIFLLSLRAALTADPAWTGTRFEGIPDRGFRAFARIYASWAASQAYYREGLHYKLGYESLEDCLIRGWEAKYRRRDPHNLLAMIDTWFRCDISDNPIYQGNYPQALAAIQARTLVMPSTTDLYFTPEDCAAEAALIPQAEYRPIPSIFGHLAGNPYQSPQDAAFLRSAVLELLSQ
jgi:homoserine O-acetyltransferase/O-succinyltransferase